MLNKVEVRVTPELIEYTAVNDEYIFRELARKMVTQMPVNELKKLIKFTKTDPNTQESRKKINDYLTDEYERHRLIMLESQQIILYEAEVSL